jgi:fructosamine-3-kinase
MENEQNPVSLTIEQAQQFAINMMVREQRVATDTIEALVNMGVDANKAEEIVTKIKEQVSEIKKGKARQDILYGALWCGGGTIATMAHIGFIFWGAILFGGIQFIKGLLNLANAD